MEGKNTLYNGYFEMHSSLFIVLHLFVFEERGCIVSYLLCFQQHRPGPEVRSAVVSRLPPESSLTCMFTRTSHHARLSVAFPSEWQQQTERAFLSGSHVRTYGLLLRFKRAKHSHRERWHSPHRRKIESALNLYRVSSIQLLPAPLFPPPSPPSPPPTPHFFPFLLLTF